MQTTILSQQTYSQRVEHRDNRPSRVDVIAERYPLGTANRYAVRVVITGADNTVFERESRRIDDPRKVPCALAAAEFEFGHMPCIKHAVIAGSDPDAALFH